LEVIDRSLAVHFDFELADELIEREDHLMRLIRADYEAEFHFAASLFYRGRRFFG
jgi:hypothetical protein